MEEPINRDVYKISLEKLYKKGVLSHVDEAGLREEKENGLRGVGAAPRDCLV